MSRQASRRFDLRNASTPPAPCSEAIDPPLNSDDLPPGNAALRIVVEGKVEQLEFELAQP